MERQPGTVISHSRDQVLDAWRGLSVIFVIFSHVVGNEIGWSRLALPIRPADASQALSPELHAFSHYIGQLGVQIFFVISGYIITALLMREFQRNTGVSLPAFYVRRAFRILPALWLALGFIAALTLLRFIAVSPSSLLLASTFLCDIRFDACDWFVAHTWSLSVEEQFYLVWPLMLVTLRFRAIAQTAFALTILFLLIGELTGVDYGRISIPLSFACIASGCLYAGSQTFRGLIERAAIIPLVTLAGVLLVSRPLIPILLPGQFRAQFRAQPFLICFVLFSCFRYRAFLERRIIVRALAAVGLASYGLYLWQQLFLSEPELYLRSSILCWAPGCSVLVVLSYFVVERPLMGIGGRISRNLIKKGNDTSARGG